jgi:hypothetical protein
MIIDIHGHYTTAPPPSANGGTGRLPGSGPVLGAPAGGPEDLRRRAA